MAATVNLPGGPASKKWVLGGGAVVAGIVGYAYLRRSRQAAAMEVTPPTPSELPPADLSTVSTGGGTTSTGLQFITTNAEWSQDATAKLVDLGYDSVAVSTALGKYLSSQLVTSQEAQYIYTAIALSGHPPVGEFSVRLEPTPTSTSSTPTPTAGARPETGQTWSGQWPGGTPIRVIAVYFATHFRGTVAVAANPNITGHFYNLIIAQNPVLAHRTTLPRAMRITVHDV